MDRRNFLEKASAISGLAALHQILQALDEAQHLSVGYFGASTGVAAALVAAARLGESIGAVVSRGGRPDLAGDILPLVAPPTLLIVGGADGLVIELNKEAFASLQCKKEMKIVPGARERRSSLIRFVRTIRR